MSRRSTHIALWGSLSLSLATLAACQGNNPITNNDNLPTPTINADGLNHQQIMDTIIRHAKNLREENAYKIASASTPTIIVTDPTWQGVPIGLTRRVLPIISVIPDRYGLNIPGANWISLTLPVGSDPRSVTTLIYKSVVLPSDIASKGSYIDIAGDPIGFWSVVDSSGYTYSGVAAENYDQDNPERSYLSNPANQKISRARIGGLKPGLVGIYLWGRRHYMPTADLKEAFVARITFGGDELLKLEREHEAFSPNGDGSKDTNTLTISATGDWELSVDGHPGALGGVPIEPAGNQTFQWNGKVGDQLLPDGKYTLRLKFGEQEDTKEVIIDTAAPQFEKVAITKIEFDKHTRLFSYTYDVVFPSESNLTDVKPENISLVDSNVAFEPTNTTVKSQNERYESVVPFHPVPIQKLDYEFEATDEAGNKGTIRSSLSASLFAAGDAVNPSQVCATGGSGYQVLAKPDKIKPKPPKPPQGQQPPWPATPDDYSRAEEFFEFAQRFCLEPNSSAQNENYYYVNSDPSYKYLIQLDVKNPLNNEPVGQAPPIILNVPATVRFMQETSNREWVRFDDYISNGTPLTWNGRFQNQPGGEIAPMDRYKVDVRWGAFTDAEDTRYVAPGVYDFDYPNERRLKSFKVVNEYKIARGFEDNRTFKRAYGDPLKGRFVWHHIVEQRLRKNPPRLPTQQIFTPAQINNIGNEIYIDAKLNADLNDYYSSVQAVSAPEIFRAWVGRKSYDEQHRIGVSVMQELAAKGNYVLNYEWP